MNSQEFELYQKIAERVKDEALQENRRLQRQLAEKEQNFELVKQVHFNRHMDLKSLNDIIIGCTGCLHTMMFSNKKVLSDMEPQAPLYQALVGHRPTFEAATDLEVLIDLIPDFTTIVYPVGTSDLVEGHHHHVNCIVMLYPSHLMDAEVLTFLRSFMIVNEVLINIVLTRERMKELIETDPLTKAFNRLAWRESIQRYLYEHNPFFILFVDLDNFKEVNDRFGHQKGDDILKLTADWLKSSFRSDDRVFRLGGDEFAVLGFISPLDDIGFESKLSDLNNTYVAEVKATLGIAITVSLGCYITHGKHDEDEIYAIVDELLYSSKANGKNTITLVSELEA